MKFDLHELHTVSFVCILIQTRQGLISLHYLPIIFIPIFFFLWYFILIFFYPCVQHFYFTQAWCSGACYLDQLIMGTIDWIVSSWLPILLTIIFNLVLIIRFVRAYRKLVRQLLFITLLFLIHYLLFIVLSTIQLVGVFGCYLFCLFDLWRIDLYSIC